MYFFGFSLALLLWILNNRTVLNEPYTCYLLISVFIAIPIDYACSLVLVGILMYLCGFYRVFLCGVTLWNSCEDEADIRW